ncbi:hypothetical protein BU15DRAFT_87883 [Melanogaster broomeanus]|nr:hypothetical protein BU15DRAFT_87883 [Melanogaster broomeanus]
MQGQPRPSSRIATYHNAKSQLLGNQAGQVPPAWRDQKPNIKEQGSKILLSRLPPDVGEVEVEELFRKTVGPLTEAFLIYNSQGRSKGMAVVSFQRSGDAAVARAKYDGKFIDGRRPIKIEIVVDSNNAVVKPPPAQKQPSLLSRLGGMVATNTAHAIPAQNHTPNGNPAATSFLYTHAFSCSPRKLPAPRAARSAPVAVVPRRRYQKGPRRLKKTLDQLNREMEEYRAGMDTRTLNGE